VNIKLSSSDGAIRYEDISDHFENGLLRLMNLSRDEFLRWLEFASARTGEEAGVLERLRDGWERLRPVPAAPRLGTVDDGPEGRTGQVWQAAIAETPTHGVAVSGGREHGWLVRWDGARFVRETSPPAYEEGYFEGDKREAGGYGGYAEQAAWRREKSARQVRELREHGGLDLGRVLDIGSGYGYFRMALADAGYEHDGLEVSSFAREAASHAGLATYAGELEDHWRGWGGRYDAVTLFDVIEHVSEPASLLTQIAFVLRPGGVVGIKTPNLNCPEAELFGAHYHSLKREHLTFFSASSLTATAAVAGLRPQHVTTVSHLLAGFVGTAQTRAWERELRGADLVAWYRLERP